MNQRRQQNRILYPSATKQFKRRSLRQTWVEVKYFFIASRAHKTSNVVAVSKEIENWKHGANLNVKGSDQEAVNLQFLKNIDGI